MPPYFADPSLERVDEKDKLLRLSLAGDTVKGLCRNGSQPGTLGGGGRETNSLICQSARIRLAHEHELGARYPTM